MTPETSLLEQEIMSDIHARRESMLSIKTLT